MKICICEDERAQAEELSLRVGAFLRGRGYPCEIDIYADAASLLRAERDYSLALLDCRLPDMNGLEAARTLSGRKNKPVIVFISAYSEYVYDSFEVGTFRYLLKPVDDAALEKTLNSFLEYYEHNIVIDLPTGNRTWCVRIEDIIYIESSLKNSIVRVRKSDYLPDTAFEAMRSLADYTDLIRSPAFFRTHKRFFVNMRYIEKIENNVITLTIGERVEISRRRRAAFNDAYNRYLMNTV